MRTIAAIIIGLLMPWVGAGFGGTVQQMHAIVAKKRAAGGASFTDNFNRANIDPMDDPASGGTWTPGAGAWANPKINTNSLLGNGLSGCRMLTPSFASDQKCTITIGEASPSAHGPMVRVQSTTDVDGYLAYIASTTSIQVYRVADTGTIAVTAIGAAITISAITTGDTIGISASGTTLEVFRNGVSQGTRTDATHSGGQPGIYINGSHYIDSVTAEDL